MTEKKVKQGWFISVSRVKKFFRFLDVYSSKHVQPFMDDYIFKVMYMSNQFKEKKSVQTGDIESV